MKFSIAAATAAAAMLALTTHVGAAPTGSSGASPARVAPGPKQPVDDTHFPGHGHPVFTDMDQIRGHGPGQHKQPVNDAAGPPGKRHEVFNDAMQIKGDGGPGRKHPVFTDQDQINGKGPGHSG